MPVEMEKALAKSAAKKGLTGKRRAAYIWSVMNKWKKKHNGR